MIAYVFQIYPENFAFQLFFYKQHIYKQRQDEIDKKIKQLLKQHPEDELLLFENYSHSSSTLSSKYNRAYSKR